MVCATFSQILTLYGMYYLTQKSYVYNFYYDTLFLTFHRSIWACSLCVMIYWCLQYPKGTFLHFLNLKLLKSAITIFSGIINQFLSLNVWRQLSKLSYCMYIVHFQWQIIVDSLVQAPEYFGFIQMVSMKLLLPRRLRGPCN